MKRREFLKYAGLMGAGSVLPLAPSMQLFAAQDNYTGPLWITIEAQGGWDPTSFCDPKGYTDPTDPARINNYAATDIRSVGNFSVAPPPDRFIGGNGVGTTDGDLYTKYIDPNNKNPLEYSAEQFFNTYQSKLLVINGIDVKTVAHGDGQRHTWGGELGRGGFPNFGALVSGTLASTRPIPFLTNGGYSDGGGLVTPVRINGSGQAALAEIAYPNRTRKGATSPGYFPQEVADLIQQTSAARLDDLDNAQYLPRIKAALSKLKTSRVVNSALQDFVDAFDPANLPRKAGEFRSNRSYQMYFQANLAMAAYTTGATAAAHISLGGFDTHSSHDENQYMRLMDLLEGIDAIVQAATLQGLDNQIVIIVGSDFGRTNKYNDNTNPGKNHWPITSMMFMGNDTQIIKGNRVIGSTDAAQKATTIDPVTLQSKAAADGGVRITPAHIHRALRRLAGVDTTSAASSEFFLPAAEDIDFFS